MQELRLYYRKLLRRKFNCGFLVRRGLIALKEYRIFFNKLPHTDDITESIQTGAYGGGVSVVNTKRIMISIPSNLLQEVDGVVQTENTNRSEIIRNAMKMYLGERKKQQIRESMQRGYIEMADINLNIALEAMQAEEEADEVLEKLVSGV